MPTEATFRFSTYLTLALACVTLGYSHSELLPEVAVFAGLAVATLGVLYFLETRVTMLSIPAANRLGLGVSIVYLLWVGYRVKRELDTGEFHMIGWHMLIVAMCGPLVMMVLAAKVARGDKHAGDYWTLHGTALAGVALAAAFAEEPACFVLVGCYLIAAVWSLTLFHLARAAGHVPPIPNPATPAPKTASVATAPHGSRSDFRPALVCALVAAAVAVPVYLLTPRSEAAKADFGKPRIEIGYAADQMVDLNRTGPLKANNEIAFEVTATHPDGTAKTDLNPEQRWRGRTHHRYGGGEWKKEPGRLPSVTATAKQTTPWVAPNLGPGQFTLTFDVPPTLPSYFLADPVMWLANKQPPIAGLTESGPRGWLPSPDGTFFWEAGQQQRGQAKRYIQAHNYSETPNLGPGFQLASVFLDDSLSQLRQNPVPRVKEYADKLLAELIQAGELPAAWRDPAEFLHPATRLPREEHHDLIARKFTSHLATTPTLRYTTDIRRENNRVDPIEDFLFHSKTGHCERFATALVLLLRSQGIPSVFVLGFKGCEHVDAGKYLVKQEHAHAWAEALVSLPIPEAERRAGQPLSRYHWRSLDPTPGGADPDAAGPNSPWWQRANSWVETQFQEYVTNYTPEQRRKALTSFIDRVARIETLVGVCGVVLLLVGLRYYLRRRANPAAAVAEPPEPTRWFGELVALLSANGFAPASGDTAREFAERATAGLRERPGCSEVAEVPIAWAEAYYQDRFGGIAPSDARLAELESDLDALRRVLET